MRFLSGLPDWDRTQLTANTPGNNPCSERTKLAWDWVQSAQECSRLEAELAVAEAALPSLEYNQFFNKVQQARIDADNLRLLLEAHRSEHGC